MNETNLTRFKKRALALAIASCMSLSPLLAEAASLGKLTVLSGLGQPLRAELELGATPDEISGMTARLAPVDAFKQAGVDYAPVLSELRFVLDKRANGASVIRVTSSKPLNEPFLDFLVELNWPSGRLLREYTFLLDPPDVSEKPPARSVVDARVVETVRGGAGEARPAAPARSARTAPAPKVAEEARKPVEKADTRVVQRGETLRKIAAETQHEGVSLEQMLVGLFRSNPDAFSGQNLNRLKSGAILSIPDKSAVESLSEAEARKIYVAQAGDWNAYRQKLAAATAKGAAKDDSGSAQAASGKITAKVEEKAVPADKSKDQVKVARADAVAKGADAARSAAEEDRVTREKAYKEAQERLVALEKNVGDLQKLLDLKNQKLAELQQAPAKKEEAKPAVEPAKPAAEEPKPVAPTPPLESKQAEPPKAVEEVKQQAAAPAPAKPAPKKVAPPPPPPEPELLDTLLEDPLPLAAGGGVLAALLAFLFIKRRRASGGSALTTTAAPVSSGLGPNSVFRMTGGQSIDTGNTPPQTGDFSQTGPGTIDTDEVDPVAEADVYMAYGRDTQAEEILLEALQKDPQRTAIHAKLLEIYANRGSLKQFETLASELYAQTGGAGPDWAKVAELGARLDPKNPLYSGGHVPAVAAVAAAVIPELPADEPVLAEEPSVPSFDDVAAAAPLEDMAAEPLAEDVAEAALDFDLGEPAATDNAVGGSGGYIDTTADEAEPNVLDFDLGGELPSTAPISEPKPAVEPAPVDEAPSALDFDLGLGAPVAPAEKPDDFSPEATLIMPLSAFQDEPAFDLGAVEEEMPAPVEAIEALDIPEVAEPAEEAAAEPAALDFDFDVLPPADTRPEKVVEPVLPEEAAMTSTVIDVSPPAVDDLDFDVSLGDSVFLGDAMPAPDFDIGAINLDLSAEPAAAPAPAAAGEAVRDQRWEEVNTKLDLAKAYEEMGDLEGARELLDEVVAEGVADLAEQAKVILARLGG